MNFSVHQWLLSIVLDVLIKTAFIYCAFVLVTFLAAPALPFIYIAVAVSIFHFVCLFLACSFVASLELIQVQLARAAKFPLVLTIANVLFVGSVTAFLTFSVRPDEIWLTGRQCAVISLLLMLTNLISMLIVAAYGCNRSSLSQSR